DNYKDNTYENNTIDKSNISQNIEIDAIAKSQDIKIDFKNINILKI
ncbi:2321_t:CDS:1, partial [Dentiscutata heterogama]